MTTSEERRIELDFRAFLIHHGLLGCYGAACNGCKQALDCIALNWRWP